MLRSSFKILSLALFVALGQTAVCAQKDASTPSGRPEQQQEELPKNIKESLEKGRIAQEQKDHDEMLQRDEEAIKLSGELQSSFTQNHSLTSEDKKKLDRLEKILKKIRGELGGDDDGAEPAGDKTDEPPSTVGLALNKLQATAAGLFDELKKTTRFSVSAIAIQSSNALLKIVRFIRFLK